MEVGGSAREFANWIGEIIRFDLSENEDSYVFSRDSLGQDFNLEIEKHNILIGVQRMRITNSTFRGGEPSPLCQNSCHC
ncbi:hypothetical protein [Vibrio aerogenes]|uniref:hypothetical protein n=1 Tax=Vibrio aerogenes TaxID=92172 RepID=UPI0011146F74|nr:hypothetical protein [Vibrio aerogenes]